MADALALLLLLAVFVIKLLFLWPNADAPGYYYSDSPIHVLSQWSCIFQRSDNRPITDFLKLPLQASLQLRAWAVWPELFYGPLALNQSLCLMALGLVYVSARIGRCGPRAAVLAGLFAASLPALGRLALSGQPEPSALVMIAAAAAVFCANPFDGSGLSTVLAWSSLLPLWLAAQTRAEAMGLLVLFTVLLSWRLRRQKIACVGLVAILFLASSFQCRPFLDHLQRAAASNFVGHGPPVWDRLLHVPRALSSWRNPGLALLTAAAYGCWTGQANRNIRDIGVIGLAHLLLLWIASWWGLMSWETERNLCAPLILCCIPAAAAVGIELQRRARHPFKAVAALTLAAGVACSGTAAVIFPPPDAVPNTSSAGRLAAILRPLARLGFFHGQPLLVEETGLDIAAMIAASGFDAIHVSPNTGPPIPPCRSSIQNGDQAWGILAVSRETAEANAPRGSRVQDVYFDAPIYALYRFTRNGP